MAEEPRSPVYRLLQRRRTLGGFRWATRWLENQVDRATFDHWRYRLRSVEQYAKRGQWIPSLMRADAVAGERPRLLVIRSGTPTPDRDSGSLRMFELLRLLAQTQWSVTYAPSELQYVAGYAQRLHALGVSVLHQPLIDTLEDFLHAHGKRYDCILLSMLETARYALPHLRRYAPQARIIFDTVDLHFVRLEREAALAADPGLQSVAATCRERELALAREVDCTIVVSEEEQRLLTTLAPSATVSVLSNIHTVRPASAPFADRSRILFLGSFGHPPNPDAAQFLVRAIWPQVARALPQVRLTIAGHGSSEQAALLAGERVDVLGHVADLDALFEETRVCVAPLRYGAGVKGKINESLSCGVPVVTTSIGAEGMHLRHGTNCLIADDTAAFAREIVRAYTDEELWRNLSQAGPAVIDAHFSPHVARRQWRKIERLLFPAKTLAPRRGAEPRVAAIIPTAGKDAAMLRRCLQALRGSAHGVSLRTIVVLCPTDPHRMAAARSVLDDGAELIPLSPPFSFARSNNAGLDLLRDEDTVLMLNDDCFFRGSHDLLRLVEQMRRNRLGCIGPWIRHLAHLEELPVERRRWLSVARSHLPLVGACLLWDRPWLDEVGRFDESFAGYGMEEADLLFRLLNAGGRWARFNRVQVDHLHHATFGGDIKVQDAHLQNLERWRQKYPRVDSWGGSPEWHRNLL